MRKACLVTVQGRVQGVGFRYYTRIQARRNKIVGWVRNCPDGSVQVRCEGESGNLARFLTWLQSGPPAAAVQGVQKQDVPLSRFPNFTIEY